MWAEVKTDYLNRVEQALSAARHPRSFEILADVSSHLDSRFAELGPQQQTWENFQNITTEMGPPSEYAELIGQVQPPDEKGLSAGFLIALVLILTAVAVGDDCFAENSEKKCNSPAKSGGQSSTA